MFVLCTVSPAPLGRSTYAPMASSCRSGSATSRSWELGCFRLYPFQKEQLSLSNRVLMGNPSKSSLPRFAMQPVFRAANGYWDVSFPVL